METENKISIVMKLVDEIKPYARNAKMHTKEQIDRICESIKQFGFNQPIAIDEYGEILAGHGRLLAAKLLNLKTVPCLVVAGLNDEQKKAYRLVDNKLNMDTDFDLGLMQLEIEDICKSFDLTKLCGDLAQFSPPIPEEFPEKKKSIAHEAKKVSCPNCGESFPI